MILKISSIHFQKLQNTAFSRSTIRSTSQPKVYLESLILILAIVFIYLTKFAASSIESNWLFSNLAYDSKTIPQINNI